MTYVVPNYFLENNYKNLTHIDNLLCLHSIVKGHNSIVDARNTMHSMNILIEGSKIIHTENKNITIEAKEICFLTQNNYYMSERMTKESRYKSMVLYFDDTFVLEFIKKYTIKLQATRELEILKITYKQDRFFTATVTLFEEYLEHQLPTELLKLKVEEIFLHVLRLKPKELHSFLSTILNKTEKRVLHILESNIDIIENIKDMCTLTHLTSNQLRRYIKKQAHTTPKLWIDTKRLQKATLLLKNSDKNITEIATECGYATSSWFISQFKKEYAQTPKEFREKNHS
ncbi:helix-turn-helix domain-containing protein [Sulfurimonas sp.]